MSSLLELACFLYWGLKTCQYEAVTVFLARAHTPLIPALRDRQTSEFEGSIPKTAKRREEIRVTEVKCVTAPAGPGWKISITTHEYHKSPINEL